MRQTAVSARRILTYWRCLHAFLLAILLVSCQNVAAPVVNQNKTSTPHTFAPLDELLASKAAHGEVSTAGYLIVDSVGATLVEGLGFAADGTPHLLAKDNQIWLGADLDAQLKTQLRAAGAFQFAPVRVRGQLENSGGYGPNHSYHYQLVRPNTEVITAQETTIPDLLENSASYEGRLVRLAGNLIAGNSSALLVDQLGAGGLPLPKARQIKLRTPFADQELLGRLKSVSGGSIRFGHVQIEGFWRAGVLIPLSTVLVT